MPARLLGLALNPFAVELRAVLLTLNALGLDELHRLAHEPIALRLQFLVVQFGRGGLVDHGPRSLRRLPRRLVLHLADSLALHPLGLG